MEKLTEFLASCEFASPLRFGIGSALLLVCIFFPLFQRRRGLALNLAYWRRRVALGSRGAWALSGLVAITSILLAAALTDPQMAIKQRVPLYGKPVMVVVDVSGSMEYRGRAGREGLSSIEKARAVFDDLIARRVDADFGLLLYSTERYIARYFAFKDELLRDTLENTEEVTFISTGTRTAEALAQARTFLLEHIDAKEKAVLLISDLEGDLEALVQMAEEMERNVVAGIKVYAIIIEREGQRTRDEDRGPTQIEGVRMVSMNDESGIDQTCSEIAALDYSPVGEEEILTTRSLVPHLILPVLGFFVLFLFLSETRFRKIP